MLIQLSLASLMVLFTVAVHLVGLSILIRLFRSDHPLFRPVRLTTLGILMTASLGIFAIHTVEIWFYALLFVALGAIGSFEESLYFSTVTYASIGYGDVLMAKSWRILGAIEGTTGIIMLGWSTAFLVSLLTQLRLLSHDWLSPSLPALTGDETP